MSCIRSVACIHIYMCIFIQSRSPPKSPSPPTLSAQACSSAARFFPLPQFLWPSGEKLSLLFWGQKIWLRNEGRLPVPPRGVTIGRGREWELPEHDGSRKCSRIYSKKLWMAVETYFLVQPIDIVEFLINCEDMRVASDCWELFRISGIWRDKRTSH